MEVLEARELRRVQRVDVHAGRGQGALDVRAGPAVEYPIWAAVHGLAVLLRGPLQALPERERARLEDRLLAFIGAAVS